MSVDHFVNLLFYPRPHHWGLRGDPLLWTDLEHHMRLLPIPASANDLHARLMDLYSSLVGRAPVPGDSTYVHKYRLMGMSSGVVSADFYLNTAFPLLLDRYALIREN